MDLHQTAIYGFMRRNEVVDIIGDADKNQGGVNTEVREHLYHVGE